MLVPYDNSPGLRQLLADIYLEAFPPEERRPADMFFSLAVRPDVPFYILVIYNTQGSPIGFISYWSFDAFAYVEHFAVSPAARSGGVGGRALQEFLARNRKPVVLEVERPGSNDMADRRIAFYRRNGFHTIDSYDYIQPSYAPGLPEVPLLLMCDRPGEVDPGEVDAILRSDVYGYMKYFC